MSVAASRLTAKQFADDLMSMGLTAGEWRQVAIFAACLRTTDDEPSSAGLERVQRALNFLMAIPQHPKPGEALRSTVRRAAYVQSGRAEARGLDELVELSGRGMPVACPFNAEIAAQQHADGRDRFMALYRDAVRAFRAGDQGAAEPPPTAPDGRCSPTRETGPEQ